ncbi:2Fe-2S iron-sulfur cluster-binding protein [Oceanobacter mangrovi]|uniref:2Fe-2S iron-sulfur cluster-binding protein n=1 Tax=Oceanobacter mangrovi TaxID=2862510 RepID=UPI001C8EDD07|nr:2Fe-2S iron-sulfur cluster-binding protein [Oceanobacter mangrovi]
MTQQTLSEISGGKSCHQVSISNQGQCTLSGNSQANLLVQLGKNSPVLVGCKGGGCGKCRIKVTEGTYTSKKMSRAHISPRDEEQSIVLACRIFPRSDLSIIPLKS